MPYTLCAGGRHVSCPAEGRCAGMLKLLAWMCAKWMCALPLCRLLWCQLMLLA